MATEKEQLARVNDALTVIFESTNQGSAAASTIAAAIDRMLQEIADSDSLEEAQAVAERAEGIAPAVAQLGVFLAGIASSVEQPVPEPPPDPLPEPEPEPEPDEE